MGGFLDSPKAAWDKTAFRRPCRRVALRRGFLREKALFVGEKVFRLQVARCEEFRFFRLLVIRAFLPAT